MVENNLNTRRNLRANIERQSLQINEQFTKAFRETFQHLQTLSNKVNFIDTSCRNMMSKIEVSFIQHLHRDIELKITSFIQELKFQTMDFLKQTNDVNTELRKLDINETVLKRFCERFQLDQSEIALISSSGDHASSQTIDDRFFAVLQKIQSIHETAKGLANEQHITGFVSLRA